MSQLLPKMSEDEFKAKAEKEHDIEVVYIHEMIDTCYDRQTFLILEWNNKCAEYVIRRYYHFLDFEQRAGQGSGSYPVLRDKAKDLGCAKDAYWKDVEILAERGERLK